MRRLVLFILAAPAIADPVEDAAEKVLAAHRAGEAAALKALGEKDDPDPWLVADELCARGEHDAAEAFARAAPRPDTETLPEYVASRRAKVPDARTRKALATAITALAECRFKEALVIADATDDPLGAVRIADLRGRALEGLGRVEESVAAFRQAVVAAEAMGWLSRAAASLHSVGVASRQGGDPRGALRAWSRRLAVEERRERGAGIAAALGDIGVAYYDMRDYAVAIEWLERSLRLAEELGDKGCEARALVNLGSCHRGLKDSAKALALYQRALGLLEEAGQRGSAGAALGNIGLIHAQLLDFPQALECQTRALSLMQEAGDRLGAAVILDNIAFVHRRQGNVAGAIDFRERSLAAYEEIGNRPAAAEALTDLGQLHYSAGDYRRALDSYQRCLPLMEATENRPGVAGALDGIGEVNLLLGDYPNALEYCERARKLREELGDRAGVARTLQNLASVHRSLGDYPKALECCERAQTMMEELGDRNGVAAALRNLGNLHRSLGDYAKALECCERARSLVEDPLGVAAILGSIGNVHTCLADYAKALEYHERARELAEELGSRAGLATALANIGDTHLSLGAYPKALDCLERARKLMEGLGDRAGVGHCLGHIGHVHRLLGNYAKALECCERARKLMEELGHRAGLADALLGIGNVHCLLGDLRKALEYQQRALKLSEQLGDRGGIARAVGSIGAVHLSLGDYPNALVCLERALKLTEELGDRACVATNLLNIGTVHRGVRDYPKALVYLRRAQKLTEELGDRARAVLALANIGRVLNLLGDYPKALEYGERALSEAERLGTRDYVAGILSELSRTHLARGDPERAVALSRRAVEVVGQLAKGLAEEEGATARERFQDIFDVGTRAALVLGDIAGVSFFLESGRAMTLLESLGGRQRMQGFILPQDLRDTEAAARAAESVALATYRRALGTGDDVDLLWKEAEGTRGRVIDATRRIQREAKVQADVVYPEAAPLDRIIGSLGDGEALVTYALLPEEAIALVVARKGARIVRLGRSEAIAKAAAALHAAVLRPDERGVAAPPHERLEFVAKRLRALVVEPLGLKDTKRLLVAPDGDLAYVPFALLAPGIEIAYVPSGTTYGVLLDDAGLRGEGVLALGDPPAGDPQAASVYRGGEDFAPLPASRAEAETIGDVVLVGKDATETGFLAAVARRPRWHAVHLACHGLVRADQPELSCLALGADGTNDGFLTVLEVFRTKVPADLVVLSACETAKGKVYRAEGVIGLARAFMLAGSPRVLCSLWKVDDAATRELMTNFYKEWKPGVGAAAALRRAQQHVASQEKWKDPYFWAAWQLWGLPE